jgi:1A family penicillin-binding protein
MSQKKYHRQVFQKGQKIRFFLRTIEFFIGAVLLFLFLIAAIFIFYARDLPRPESFTERPFVESTKIYDRSGKVVLYEFYGEEKRRVVSINQVPDYLKKAVIAAEDVNFYSHFGIDLKGIGRAIFADLKLRKPVQGGSTISQQLIRSAFLSREKTLGRKVREIILTLELERRYSKDQILEWYLNQVPFGSNAYGVEAASQIYFQKSVSEISLAEATTLASIIRAPSDLSPYGPHKDDLLNTKNSTLEKMAELGFISKEDAEKAEKEEINFVQLSQPIKAPHFVMYVRSYLIQKYGESFLRERGLNVYTSLDWDIQEVAEKAVKEGAEKNKAYRAYNAALVTINPNTGEILAMVGSKDFFGEPLPKGCTPGSDCLFDPQVNVTIQPRQPGSSFKPFVYATAFKKGYNDKTIVEDSPACWPQGGGKYWCPQNYDGLFRGPVTLRAGLAQSLNVPSVKVLDSLAGFDDSIKTAQELGITTLTNPSSYGLSIVLGGAEVKLLDMTSAFGVFATSGLRSPPIAILKIVDNQGKIIEESKNTPKRVLSEEIANLITDILSDNEARAPIFGYSSPMYFENIKVAAKTGTTQNYKDGWIIGYTPSIVAGVWAGNNDGTPILKEPGIMVAGPIWRYFMEKILSRG